MEPTDHIIIHCPHCGETIFVYKNEIRCAIFRHAVLKDTMTQIDPHSPKQVCDDLVKNDKVYGCARPFRLQPRGDGEWEAVVCDYI